MEEKQREFLFTEADFRHIAKMVYDHAGIVMSDRKGDLIYGRLARRLRALGLRSFKDYRKLLADPDKGPQEIVSFVNALTTNLTKFFREGHHFEHLGKQVLRPLAEREPKERRLRVWSAGCSTGEEAYSIAMTICEHLPGLNRWDARILATDLDTAVLEHGRNGEYKADRVDGIPRDLRARYLDGDPPEDSALARRRAERAGTPRQEGTVRMAERLRDLIAFKHLNLLGAWPMKGPFDAIFCRNVMIYFDKPTQATLVRRYADLLRPGGWLYIGHSENIGGMDSRLTLTGKTIYRRAG